MQSVQCQRNGTKNNVKQESNNYIHRNVKKEEEEKEVTNIQIDIGFNSSEYNQEIPGK